MWNHGRDIVTPSLYPKLLHTFYPSFKMTHTYSVKLIIHNRSYHSIIHSKSMTLVIQKSIISLSNQTMKIDHLKSIFDTLSLMDNESIHVSILTFKWHQLMMFVSTDIGYLWLCFNYMLRISVPSVVAKVLTSLHLNLGGTVAIWTVFRERLFRETV